VEKAWITSPQIRCRTTINTSWTFTVRS